MSITGKPFSKWDLRRWFYSDPLLTTLERFVAIELLACLDNKFRPRRNVLESQASLGGRLGAHRESVNRALSKLKIAGYFSTTWVTVQRSTAQGIKGVTRVLIEIGPVVRHYIETSQIVSPDQARRVMSRHPSRTLPGSPGSVSDGVVAKSADRSGSTSGLDPEDKRKALGQWPRLAGSKPIRPDALHSAVPSSDVSVNVRDPDYRSHIERFDERVAARIKATRRARGKNP
jgi:hypothetical protein